MKKLLIMALVSTNVMALDFDTEWAKFDKDFARLRGVQVALVNKPVVTKLDSLPEVNSDVNVVERVDPKSPKRLGRNLENPYMKDKLEKLYNKPDTVVYSLTLE
jgi:hypothetical protein